MCIWEVLRALEIEGFYVYQILNIWNPSIYEGPFSYNKQVILTQKRYGRPKRLILWSVESVIPIRFIIC